MPLLSFVIPAKNEERFLAQLLTKVINVELPHNYLKEIIVINDGSQDSTFKIMQEFANLHKDIKILSNERSIGKSQTVKKGILASLGDFVVIQDADLEYEPQEVATLLQLAHKNNLDVVYGNRFGKQNKVIYWQNYFGNKTLSMISNFFTYPRIKVWIPDMEVCYKLVRGGVLREVAAQIVSRSNFGFEPEVTARLSKYLQQGKHLQFGVVPISYYPRSIAEGKHMKAFRDGLKALKEIIHFNLFS